MLTSPSCRLVSGALLSAVLSLTAAALTVEGQGDHQAAEPFIRATLRLTDREMGNLEQGHAVAKTFPASLKREVNTAGAIRITGSSSSFVEQYRSRFKAAPLPGLHRRLGRCTHPRFDRAATTRRRQPVRRARASEWHARRRSQ